MRKPYNSDEEKMAIIDEYEGKGFTLISDNGTLEDGNYLEFQEPQPQSEIEEVRLETAQANAEMFEMLIMMTGGML